MAGSRRSTSRGGSAAKKAKTGDANGGNQGGGDWKSFDTYGFAPAAVAKETHKKLSWSHGEESQDGFSDWKIVVTRDASSTPSPYAAEDERKKKAATSTSAPSTRSKRKQQVTEEETIPAAAHAAEQTCTYHVHKATIGVGPRKSEYFDNLFKTQNNLAEHASSTSEIQLEGSAYDAFPSLLDYLYGVEGEQGRSKLKNNGKGSFFGPRTAVALRYLAHYFQIRQLFLDTTSFLESEMIDLANLPTYIYEANLYGDVRLAEALTDAAAGDLTEIDSEELLLLPPRIFAGIFDSGNLTKGSEALSEKVAFYCQNQAYGPDQVLDGAMLASVTDKTKMPTVSKEAAVPLLVYLEDVAADVHVDENGEGGDEEALIEANAESLRQRCAEVLSEDWRRLATKASAGSASSKKKSSVADLSETSQVKLLQACLSAARNEIVALETEHERRVQLYDDEIKAHAATKAQIHRFKPVLDRPNIVSIKDNQTGLRRAPHHRISYRNVYTNQTTSYHGHVTYKALYTYE